MLYALGNDKHFSRIELYAFTVAFALAPKWRDVPKDGEYQRREDQTHKKN